MYNMQHLKWIYIRISAACSLCFMSAYAGTSDTKLTQAPRSDTKLTTTATASTAAPQGNTSTASQQSKPQNTSTSQQQGLNTPTPTSQQNLDTKASTTQQMGADTKKETRKQHIQKITNNIQNKSLSEQESLAEIPDKELDAIVKKPITDDVITMGTKAGKILLENTLQLAASGSADITIPYLGAHRLTFETIEGTDEDRKKIRLKIAPSYERSMMMSYEEQEQKTKTLTLFDNLDFTLGRDGNLVGGGDVVINGRKARAGLRKIQFGQSLPLIVEKIVFELKFYEPVTIEWKGDKDAISFQRAALVLSIMNPYPMTLTTKVKMFGREVRFMLQFSPQRISCAARVEKMMLKDVIRWSPDWLQHIIIQQGSIEFDLWNKKSYGVFVGGNRLTEFDPKRAIRIQGTLEPQSVPQAVDMESSESGADISLSSEQFTQELLSGQSTEASEMPEQPFASEWVEEQPSMPSDDFPVITAENAQLELPDEQIQSNDLSQDATPLNTAEIAEVIPTPEPVDLEAPLEEFAPIIENEGPSPEEEAEAARRQELEERFCRNPEEDLPRNLQYTMSASLNSRFEGELTITAADMQIPGIGIVPNITLSATRNASFELREDVYGARADLAKKTLKTAQSGLTLSADCLQIKNIGTVRNATITFEYGSMEREPDGNEVMKIKKGRAAIQGTLYLNVDSIGQLRARVDASLIKRSKRPAELMFEGTVERPISYAGIRLEKLKVIYGRLTPTITEQVAMETQRQRRYEEMAKLRNDRSSARSNMLNAGEKLKDHSEQAATLKEEIDKLQKEKIDPLVQILEGLQKKAKSARDAKTVDDAAEEQIIATEKLLTPLMQTANEKQRELAQQLGQIKEIASAPETLRAAIRAPKQISKQPYALTLIGTMQLLGLPCVVTLVTYKDKGVRRCTFGARATVKNFKPFNRISLLPSLVRETNFEDVFISLTLGRFGRGKRPDLSLGIGGTAKILGTRVRAALRTVQNRNGNRGLLIYSLPGTTVYEKLPKGVEDKRPELQQGDIVFTDFLTPLKGKAGLDEVIIRNPQLIISTINQPDTSPFAMEEDAMNLPYLITKGVTFTARMPLTGPLEKVRSVLGLSSEHMFGFVGQLAVGDRTFKGSKLAVNLSQAELQTLSQTTEPAYSNSRLTSVDQTFAKSKGAVQSLNAPIQTEEGGSKPLIQMGGAEVYLIINTPTPEIGLAGEIIVNPPRNPEPLRLKGSFEFGPTAVTFGAQMLGVWSDPFGLKGWEFGNVGMILGFAPPSIVPKRLGGAALMRAFSKFSFDFKFIIDPAGGGMAFEGNASKILTTMELIKLTFDALNIKIPGTDKFPMPLELNNVSLRFAPVTMRVGDQLIDFGYLVKADIKLFDQPGHVEISVNDNGLKAFGTMKKINFLNVLKITDKEGTGDPKVDIELTFDRQQFLITGMLQLASLYKKVTYVQLNSSGFEFEFTDSIGSELYEGKPLLESKVIGKSSGSFQDPQFVIVIEFQQNLQKFIRKQVLDNVEGAQRQVIDALNTAQNEVAKAQKTKEDADRAIKAARDRVNALRSAVEPIREAREKAKKDLQSAKDAVASIRKEIDKLKQWYSNLPDF